MKSLLSRALGFAVWLGLSTVTLAGPMDAQMVVANRGSGSISVIDVDTSVVRTFALPAGNVAPEPMYAAYSPSNDLVFVGDRANNRVVAFNARTFSVVQSNIPVGRGVFHMWGDAPRNQLWVNNDIDKSISVIDMRNFTTLATIPTPNNVGPLAKPHDVILDPARPHAYVTLIDAAGPNDFVVKYSTSTFTELDRQPVGQDPHVVLSRHNPNLYVANQNTSTLDVLDRMTLDPLTSLGIANAHGVTMTADGRILYVSSFPGNGVNGLHVIDTLTNTLINSVNTPMLGVGPHNLALSPDNTRLFITHTGGASTSVSIYDTSGANRTDPLHLGNASVGTNPFGIAVVPAAIVPEPGTLALFAAGGLVFAVRKWRRQR